MNKNIYENISPLLRKRIALVAFLFLAIGIFLYGSYERNNTLFGDKGSILAEDGNGNGADGGGDGNGNGGGAENGGGNGADGNGNGTDGTTDAGNGGETSDAGNGGTTSDAGNGGETSDAGNGGVTTDAGNSSPETATPDTPAPDTPTPDNPGPDGPGTDIIVVPACVLNPDNTTIDSNLPSHAVSVHYLSDLPAGYHVLFPTWSEQGGQDDLIWHEGVNAGAGSWTHTVNFSQHPDLGLVIVHVYTVAPDNSSTYCGQITFTRQAPVTPNPAPVCVLTANPATITAGQSTTLSWTSSNATTFSIDNSVGAVGLNGSTPISPPNSTTYTGTVTGPGGSATCSAPVTVTPITITQCVAPTVTSSVSVTTTVGSPFNYTITTAGTPPTSISVSGLPPGLTYDASSHIIQGFTSTVGTFNVSVSSSNACGSAGSQITISVVPAQCVANQGAACSTGANICGMTNTGVVGCDGSCTATSPIPSNSQCPPSTLICTASPSTGGVGSTFTFTASGANGVSIPGPYTWSADSSASQTSGSGTTFSTSFNTTGGKAVTVTANGLTATCGASVTGVTPPAGPTCVMSISPNTIFDGQSTTLEVSLGNNAAGSVDNGIGAVSAPGGTFTISPHGQTTYTGTFTNANGSVICAASIGVNALTTAGGGGGSGGGTGGTSGGGPIATVSPLAPFVYLSQIPYTGFGDNLLTTFFIVVLLGLSGAFAYAITYPQRLLALLGMLRGNVMSTVAPIVTNFKNDLYQEMAQGTVSRRFLPNTAGTANAQPHILSAEAPAYDFEEVTPAWNVFPAVPQQHAASMSSAASVASFAPQITPHFSVSAEETSSILEEMSAAANAPTAAYEGPAYQAAPTYQEPSLSDMEITRSLADVAARAMPTAHAYQPELEDINYVKVLHEVQPKAPVVQQTANISEATNALKNQLARQAENARVLIGEPALDLIIHAAEQNADHARIILEQIISVAEREFDREDGWLNLGRDRVKAILLSTYLRMVPSFVGWLTDNNSKKVFGFLTMLRRQGHSDAEFMKHIIFALDTVYRSRLSREVAVDPDLVQILSRLTNREIETMMAILMSGVDESYASPEMGIKLAVTRIMEEGSRGAAGTPGIGNSQRQAYPALRPVFN